MSDTNERITEEQINAIVKRATRLSATDKPSEEWMGSEDEREYHEQVADSITQLRTDLAEKEEQLKVAREALERISNGVMWGIQYRYIARDGLGDRRPLEDTQEFDKNGDLITDYREQDAESLVDKETTK